MKGRVKGFEKYPLKYCAEQSFKVLPILKI